MKRRLLSLSLIIASITIFFMGMASAHNMKNQNEVKAIWLLIGSYLVLSVGVGTGIPFLIYTPYKDDDDE